MIVILKASNNKLSARIDSGSGEESNFDLNLGLTPSPGASLVCITKCKGNFFTAA